MLSPVTLTTDFGTSDHYVAQMKGVLLGLAPGVPLVDVTHEIPPQHVHRAAWLLADLAPAFPPRTVHLAVVDPGVGSERSILAVRAGDQFYVAPDNGLLTLVLDRHPDADLVAVTAPPGGPAVVSSTFHGRDIMAPAAAALAKGTPLAALGDLLERPPVRLEGLAPSVFPGRIDAAVAWVDRFGNLVTNVVASQLATFPPDRLRLRIKGHALVGLARFYAASPPGEPLLLIGSSGRLEIAVNGGSAAARFAADAGDPVTIETT